MGQVERGQSRAITEHTAHFFHLRGVEMGYVETGQR